MFRRFAILAALLAGAVVCSSAQAQDAEEGKAVFRQYCAICHATMPGRTMIGPSLFDVVGRKSSSDQGYQYSDANKTANLTWDAATLDRYVTDPRAVIPGTKMVFIGISDEQKRRDLIAYLATLH
jgi:cytochrome c